MELSENEKLVAQVPQAFRKYLVRKGSEFEGLVGINAGDSYIELAATSFVATSSRNSPNAAENRIDLAAVSILPNLIYLKLENKTILSSHAYEKGFKNLHDVNFYRCVGVGEFLDRELPKLRLVTLEACDILDLSTFLSRPGLQALYLQGTPISRAFRETSPSAIDRIYSIFFPKPVVDKPRVLRQIEELRNSGVKVEL